MKPSRVWYESIDTYIAAETTRRQVEEMEAYVQGGSLTTMLGSLTEEEERDYEFRIKMYTAWSHHDEPIWHCSDCGVVVEPKDGWVFFEYKDKPTIWRVGHFECPERSYGSDYRDYGLEMGFFNIGRQIAGKQGWFQGNWLSFIKDLEW